jgi:hypothetical protein
MRTKRTKRVFNTLDPHKRRKSSLEIPKQHQKRKDNKNLRRYFSRLWCFLMYSKNNLWFWIEKELMPYIIRVLNCDIPYIWCPKTILTWKFSLILSSNGITVSKRMICFCWKMVAMDLCVVSLYKYYLNALSLLLHIVVWIFYQMV